MMVLKYIDKIPVGYSSGSYAGQRYGIEKTTFNSGKSIKIYAKELGGSNFISLNYYITSDCQYLKPCEMSQEKVIDFLQKVALV